MTQTPLEFTRTMERLLEELSAQIDALEKRSRSSPGAAPVRNEDLLNDLRHKRASFERDVRRLRLSLDHGWEPFRERAETSCRELRAAIDRSLLWFP